MGDTSTVAFVFVDLVGSTDLLRAIGDDASDEVLRHYFAALREAMVDAGGTEVRHLGDGMMIAFERSLADAARCAIEMQRSVDRLGRADPLLRLQIRIGLSVGEAAPEGRDWNGTPVVEAARLEAKARPGQILANDVVRRLLGNRGGFECTPVGAYELKGFSEPLACCEIAWQPDPGRPEVPLPPGLAPGLTAMVGRDEELARLLTGWAAVRDGGSAAVVVTGEPGVGATRLVSELAAAAQVDGGVVLYGRCEPDTELPYQPVAEALRWYAAACPPSVLRERVGGDGGALVKLVPSLAARVPDLVAPAPNGDRGRVADAVRGVLGRVAAVQPLLLVVDGLHHAAAATRSLVAALVTPPVHGLMLVVASHRADELADLAGAERLALVGLTADNVGELASTRVGAVAGGPDVAEVVAAETAGNPRHVLDVLDRFVATGGLEAGPGHREALARTAAVQTCPYKGLLAFQAEDADLYFGRDDDIAALLGRLAAQRVLAVVGASGSGKSSLVRAGVLPALDAGALQHSERWPAVILTPGPHPLAELAAACAGPLGTSTGALLAHLESDPAALAGLVAASSVERLVLVIDQFEECFTLCDDADERSAFCAALLTAAAAPSGSALVVLVMRADFFGFSGSVPALAAALETSTALLTPMDEDGLRQAIEQPARVSGLTLQPGLADLMLRDVAGEPGSLPLLSHALLETWKRRVDRRLTVAGYEESGGVRGAIARTAESVYLDLDPDQQQLARSVFVRLTELGEGTEDTRRRVPLAELRSAAADPTSSSGDGLGRLLATLTDARLLTAGEHTVEVAHEALIREWPRLRGWLDEDREGLRTLRHLTRAANEWVHLDRDPAELYRGARLVAANDLAGREHAALNQEEREFLDASRARAEKERRDAERRTRRLQVLVGVTSIALIAALVGGALALRQTSNAREQAREADIQRLVGQSAALMDTKRDLGLLLAVEANRRQDRVDTRGALQNALVHEPSFLGYIRDGESYVQTASFFPDGERMAVGHSDGTITVLDVETRRRLGSPIEAFDMPIVIIEMAPDGKSVYAAGEAQEQILQLDLSSGRVLQEFEPDQIFAGFALSPDGSLLAAGGYVDPPEQPEVVIWDTATGDRVRTLAGDPSPQTPEDNDGTSRSAVAFSSNGLLAVGSEADTVTLFDATTFEEVGSLGGVPGVVGFWMEFSPDGSHLATVEPRESGLMLWDVAGRQPAWPNRVEVPEEFTNVGPGRSFIIAVTETDDVLVGGRSGDVVTYAKETGEPKGDPVTLQTGSVCELDLSADGGTLAIADCNEPMVALFSLDGHATIAPIIASGDRAGGYSADNRLLWTRSPAGIEIRDARTFERLHRMPDFPFATFTRDGEAMFVVQEDGRAGAYDYRAGRFADSPVALDAPPDANLGPGAVDPATGHIALGFSEGTVLIVDEQGRPAGPTIDVDADDFVSAVHGLSFTPDGRRLAVAAQTEETVVHDTATGKPVGPTVPRAANALFSPDGSLLVGAAFNGTLAFYDGETLEPSGPPVTGSRAWAGSLAFSDDGQLLAAVALDSSARLYDVEAREQIGTTFDAGIDTSAVLRPDGSALALDPPADQGTGALAWELDPQVWREAACLEAGRNMTEAEWEQYIGGSYRATCPGWPAAA